jgi:glycosyltransferase involved in cell wall biosynthesis
MVGGVGQSRAYYDEVSAKVKLVKNIEFLGHVPFSKTDRLYEGASLFVNTSRFEGFPNSFIQAWINATPIISLNVDPDGIMAQEGMGVKSGDLASMTKDIDKLMQDDAAMKQMGENGRKYILREHDIRNVGVRTDKILKDAIAGVHGDSDGARK